MPTDCGVGLRRSSSPSTTHCPGHNAASALCVMVRIAIPAIASKNAHVPRDLRGPSPQGIESSSIGGA